MRRQKQNYSNRRQWSAGTLGEHVWPSQAHPPQVPVPLWDTLPLKGNSVFPSHKLEALGQLHPLHFFCSCSQRAPRTVMFPQKGLTPSKAAPPLQYGGPQGPNESPGSLPLISLLPRALNHHHETLHSSRLWCDYEDKLPAHLLELLHL